METILHLLPLTGAQKAAFQAAAPESEHLFLPTNDRGGASSIPQEWRERTTILLGYVPPRSAQDLSQPEMGAELERGGGPLPGPRRPTRGRAPHLRRGSLRPSRV